LIILQDGEIQCYKDDPIEYIRKQFDGNWFNMRTQSCILIKMITALKEQRKPFYYLPAFMQLLVGQLQIPSTDWRVKEAIYYIFGHLENNIRHSKEVGP